MNIKMLNTDTTMKKSATLFSLLAMLTLALPGAQAQDEHHHDSAVGTAPAAMSSGEVVKVDKEAGKLTLRHGPLENLGMPGMTMAFRVAQPGMLEQVKPGDQVRFVAEKAAGALTIVTLQPAK